MRTLITTALAAAALLAAPGPAEPAPLGESPCARMHMLLEKTVFDVNVLTADVRVDPATAREIREIVRGGGGDRDAMARAIMNADDAVLEIRFERDVDLDRFVDAVRDSLEQARAAGMISEATRQEVSRALPRWFQAVAERGFEDGDRLRYRVSGATVRTTLRSSQGQVLLRHVNRRAEHRRALLAGYFAPDTDFREPLLDSVAGCAGK